MNELFWLIIFIAPFSIVIHEVGHAIGARMVQADTITISIGSGHCIMMKNFGHVTLAIYLLYFLGGVTSHFRQQPYKCAEHIWIAICGPMMNLLVVLLLYLFVDGTQSIYNIALLFNCWLFMMNLLPIKWKGKRTDGYIIVRSLMSIHK